ncbi:hypothetical protein PPERSA_04536 [Pseudocohnilembus persalinus]|uniref:Tetratricopeptide repeat protein n=1 Tax=Pseudocohnilembus persalinus TaxID=266149 RepID=A0A0V0QTI3_PSEPJ|nr:hypothetical protein PPERSA_04536 [Pseudocohnilembus persalinus]|eukprot:KRX05499.1 hypothetical protein PPERSA_04536 [Pseudocohnilembus persalinus]
MRLSQFLEAIEKCKFSINLEEKNSDAPQELGNFLDKMSEKENTIQKQEQSIKFDKNNSKNCNNLSFCAEQIIEKQYNIKDLLQLASQLEPLNLKYIYMIEKNLEKLIEMYKQVIKQSKGGEEEGQLNLGYFLENLEKNQEAAKFLQIGMDFSLLHEIIRQNFSQQLKQCESDGKEALEQYELASKLIPKNKLLLQNLGLCVHRMGKKEEGLKKMQVAQKLVPQNDQILLNLGSLYQQDGEYQLALNCYSKALKINKKNAMALFLMGTAHCDLSNYGRAIQYFEKSANLEPYNAKVYNIWGLSLDQLGQDKKSILQFKKAIQIAPQVASFKTNLGAILFEKKKYKEGTRLFIQALEIDPEEIEKIIEKIYVEDPWDEEDVKVNKILVILGSIASCVKKYKGVKQRALLNGNRIIQCGKMNVFRKEIKAEILEFLLEPFLDLGKLRIQQLVEIQQKNYNNNHQDQNGNNNNNDDENSDFEQGDINDVQEEIQNNDIGFFGQGNVNDMINEDQDNNVQQNTGLQQSQLNQNNYNNNQNIINNLDILSEVNMNVLQKQNKCLDIQAINQFNNNDTHINNNFNRNQQEWFQQKCDKQMMQYFGLQNKSLEIYNQSDQYYQQFYRYFQEEKQGLILFKFENDTLNRNEIINKIQSLVENQKEKIKKLIFDGENSINSAYAYKDIIKIQQYQICQFIEPVSTYSIVNEENKIQRVVSLYDQWQRIISISQKKRQTRRQIIQKNGNKIDNFDKKNEFFINDQIKNERNNYQEINNLQVDKIEEAEEDNQYTRDNKLEIQEQKSQNQQLLQIQEDESSLKKNTIYSSSMLVVSGTQSEKDEEKEYRVYEDSQTDMLVVSCTESLILDQNQDLQKDLDKDQELNQLQQNQQQDLSLQNLNLQQKNQEQKQQYQDQKQKQVNKDFQQVKQVQNLQEQLQQDQIKQLQQKKEQTQVLNQNQDIQMNQDKSVIYDSFNQSISFQLLESEKLVCNKIDNMEQNNQKQNDKIVESPQQKQIVQQKDDDLFLKLAKNTEQNQEDSLQIKKHNQIQYENYNEKINEQQELNNKLKLNQVELNEVQVINHLQQYTNKIEEVDKFKNEEEMQNKINNDQNLPQLKEKNGAQANFSLFNQSLDHKINSTNKFEYTGQNSQDTDLKDELDQNKMILFSGIKNQKQKQQVQKSLGPSIFNNQEYKNDNKYLNKNQQKNQMNDNKFSEIIGKNKEQVTLNMANLENDFQKEQEIDQVNIKLQGFGLDFRKQNSEETNLNFVKKEDIQQIQYSEKKQEKQTNDINSLIDYKEKIQNLYQVQLDEIETVQQNDISIKNSDELDQQVYNNIKRGFCEYQIQQKSQNLQNLQQIQSKVQSQIQIQNDQESDLLTEIETPQKKIKKNSENSDIQSISTVKKVFYEQSGEKYKNIQQYQQKSKSQEGIGKQIIEQEIKVLQIEDDKQILNEELDLSQGSQRDQQQQLLFKNKSQEQKQEQKQNQLNQNDIENRQIQKIVEELVEKCVNQENQKNNQAEQNKNNNNDNFINEESNFNNLNLNFANNNSNFSNISKRSQSFCLKYNQYQLIEEEKTNGFQLLENCLNQQQQQQNEDINFYNFLNLY